MLLQVLLGQLLALVLSFATYGPNAAAKLPQSTANSTFVTIAKLAYACMAADDDGTPSDQNMLIISVTEGASAACETLIAF
jgi:hypothetical protein